MTVVLGLDLANQGGFARYDTVAGKLLLGRNQWDEFPVPDRIIAFGEWLEATMRGETWEIKKAGGKKGKWTISLLGILDDPVDVVGFEQITFSGPGRSGEFIQKQEGVVQYLSRKIPWQGVHVATLKKFALGDRAPPRPNYRALSKQEKNRKKTEHRKLTKAAMVGSAREWIEKLGHEPPEILESDTADATLVLAWMLVNALPGWELPEGER